MTNKLHNDLGDQLDIRSRQAGINRVSKLICLLVACHGVTISDTWPRANEVTYQSHSVN